MSLNGYLQGVTHGLHTLATIQNIKNDNLRNERADRAEARQRVIQGREDAAYEEANQVTPFKANPEHGPEVENYLKAYGQNLGLIDEKGNIKAKNKVALHAALKGDENAQHDILLLQKRRLAGEISALESSLGGRPSDDLTGLAGETNKQLQAKKEKLNRLNYADKTWVAEQTANRQKEKDTEDRSFKEKDLKIREKAAETAEKTAGKATTLTAMRDKLASMPEGLAKEAYRRQIKEQEDFELNEKRVAHENDVKKANAVEEAREKRRADAERKAAIKAGTDAVNKYYGDLEKSVKERIKELSEDPTEAASVAEYQKILKNIPAYRNVDLQWAQQGKEAPNIKNLTAAMGGGEKPGMAPRTDLARQTSTPAPAKTRTATDPQGNTWEVSADGTPVKMVKKAEQAKQSAPAKPTFENRRSAAGVNTGAAIRDMVGIGGPQERLMAIDRDLKAGLISKAQHEKYRQEILADLEGR